MPHNHTPSITQKLIPAARRASFAGQLFGARYVYFESFAFDTACSTSPDYKGGYWEFCKLSNGGFYIVPSAVPQYRVSCANGFDGQLSADAFGITVCLYAYSLLSFNPDAQFSELCAHQFHLLREYMLAHPEAANILRAVD
jgi:hypothetical protein